VVGVLRFEMVLDFKVEGVLAFALCRLKSSSRFDSGCSARRSSVGPRFVATEDEGVGLLVGYHSMVHVTYSVDSRLG